MGIIKQRKGYCVAQLVLAGKNENNGVINVLYILKMRLYVDLNRLLLACLK